MVYVTGDIHGDVQRIIDFSENAELTCNDVIIILGDVGLNYYGGKKDMLKKKQLSRIKPTIFCIHGNHEKRPHHIRNYKLIDYKGGKVWQQPTYPNILFAKDGEIYDFGKNMKCMAIGGAYSIDKQYRLCYGLNWFDDEQPSDEIKSFVEKQLNDNEIDIILSHTCPIKYEPVETFVQDINQSKIDKSTEKWLDKIEESTNYKKWYCGHFHTNKHIDKMVFLFERVENLTPHPERK